MASPEHVAMLEQGVKSWNVWREQNPEDKPDLRNTDLREVGTTGLLES